MLEHCLRALLADPNLPEQAVARAVADILDTYKRENEVDSLVEHSWHVLGSSARNWALCAGPIAYPTRKTVRVTRVISLQTYLQFFVDHERLLSLGLEDPAIRTHAEALRHSQLFSPTVCRRQDPSFSHPSWPVWTTLAEETERRSPDEIRDELGMQHIAEGDSMVAIDYEVPATTLRAPTILDAGLQPWFVPKPSRHDPRAWNWRESRWGLAECVHLPNVPRERLSIRLIGQLRSSPSHDLGQTEKLTLNAGRQMMAFLEGVLQQVSAHVDLLPFIDGRKQLLDLTPTEFEHFVAALYSRAGYATTVTRASADGGIDVIAVSTADASSGLLIQAKRYSGVVGISVVRELIGARHLAGPGFRHHRLAVVTTGKFSRVARAAEQMNTAEIELHDFNSLVETLAGLGSSRLSDIYFSQVASARRAP